MEQNVESFDFWTKINGINETKLQQLYLKATGVLSSTVKITFRSS